MDSHYKEDTSFINRCIALDRLDVNLFRATNLWFPDGARGTFGGQIAAQALQSAIQTVDKDFFLHAFHAFFVRPGNPSIPMAYQVSHIRDGQSFCSKAVTAIQNEKTILTLQASFHKQLDVNISLHFQPVMPVVEHYSNLSAVTKLNPGFELPSSLLVEIRPVDLDVYTLRVADKTHRLLSWIRVYGRIGKFKSLRKQIFPRHKNLILYDTRLQLLTYIFVTRIFCDQRDVSSFLFTGNKLTQSMII